MKKSRTMTYDKDSHIKSVEDVKAFFHHLVDERKVNFHPDDDLADYILTSSLKKYIFYNWLMNNILYLCVT